MSDRRMGMGGQFSTRVITLMPVAIAINIVLGYTVQSVLKLPIYLDSIGTVLVGVLAGPLAGALTGVLSNLIWGFTLGPSSIAPFAITAAFIGFLAGVFGLRGIFSPKRGGIGIVWVIVAGFLPGSVAAIGSAPIAYYVFGGTTGGGTDVLVTIFRGITANVFTAPLLQGGFS